MNVLSNGIPTRILGATGERVTIIGVGGYHIGKGDDALGVRLIRAAIDEGITMMDNAWCYHDGKSETIMGQALRDGYRDKVFLMTKNHGRDRETFHKQLGESLKRLQVDHIDLLQYHEIIHEGEPQRIHTERALEAALEAREQGKIRYIGFTGHRWPRLLQEMLALPFEWDTAQMPINLLDAHYRSFAQDVLPTLIERNMGIIGMKSLAGGNAELLKTGVTPQEAIRYTLSQPISTLITGIDSLDVLSQNVAIARSFVPIPSEEQKALLARVAPYAGDGHLEGYKIRQ